MNLTANEVQSILELPSYGILANGRAGTDYLQSLFDGHPEVMTFNGFFLFYEFWNKAQTIKVKHPSLNDFAEEFVGHFIEKLKSKYDIQEHKDQLGENYDQFLDLGLNQFKEFLVAFLEHCELNSKTALIAATWAYHRTLGRASDCLKIFLHHPHVEGECDSFLKDFPEATLIFMTRDPRANLFSSITNYTRYYPESATFPLVYAYIQSIFSDSIRYTVKTKKLFSVKIETLNEVEIHKKICVRIGVDYNSCMLRSTWGGLLWHGDRLSQKKAKDPNSREILRNGWESELSGWDIMVINFFTKKMRTHYGYTTNESSPWTHLLAPLFVIVPLRIEYSYLSPRILHRKGLKRFALHWIYYFLQIRFLFGLIFTKSSFEDQEYF